MTTTAQATAAVHEVIIAGRKFRMSPLKDRDYGEFEAWVQDRHVNLVKRNLEGLSDDERRHQLDRAFDRAAEIGIQSDEAMAAMCTIEGVGKLVWLSIRAEHPDVSEEEVVSLMTSPENIREALDEIDNVNHMRSNNEKKARKRSGARKRTLHYRPPTVGPPIR